MSSEWIDVPVAEIAVGDSCQIDGYGRDRRNPDDTKVRQFKNEWRDITGVDRFVNVMNEDGVTTTVHRRNIVAARRRKPATSPKPGDWRCRVPGTCPECLAACGCISREVYRASGGWSRDTRTGQPWGMKYGEPAEVVIRGSVGLLQPALEIAAKSYNEAALRTGPESFSDYYKRIGLDVRPVERRGKQ